MTTTTVAAHRPRLEPRDGLAVREEAGAASGHKFACLIGAPAYFGRMGFEVQPFGSIEFPGPQDPSRVMLRRLNASSDEPYPTGKVTFPRDARRAEATQKAYLQRAMWEE